MRLQSGDYCHGSIIIKEIRNDNIVIDTCGNQHPMDTVIRISRDPAKMLRWLKTTSLWNVQFEHIESSVPYTPPEGWTTVWSHIMQVLHNCDYVEKIARVVSDLEVIPDVEVQT